MSIIPASRLSASDLARLGNNVRPERAARRPLVWRPYYAQRPPMSVPRPAHAK